MNLANYTNFDIKTKGLNGYHVWVEDIYVDTPEKAAALANEYEKGKPLAWAKHERVEGLDHWVTTEGKFS